MNRVTSKPKPIIVSDEEDKLSDLEKALLSWKRYLRYEDSRIGESSSGSGNSIQACMSLVTKEEILDGDERPKCSRCKQRRRCTKSFSVRKFPRILVLHLKRFVTGGSFCAKLSTLIVYAHLGSVRLRRQFSVERRRRQTRLQPVRRFQSCQLHAFRTLHGLLQTSLLFHLALLQRQSRIQAFEERRLFGRRLRSVLRTRRMMKMTITKARCGLLRRNVSLKQKLISPIRSQSTHSSSLTQS